MICDDCQLREATVPITRVGTEGIARVSLCEHCAAGLQGVCSPAGCRCGMTAEKLEERRWRPGCPACYQVFAESLAPIIAGCQDGKHRHVGRRPVDAVEDSA